MPFKVNQCYESYADSSIDFHKLMAWTMLVGVLIHVIGHILNYVITETSHTLKYHLMDTQAGLSGLLLLLILFIIYIGSCNNGNKLFFIIIIILWLRSRHPVLGGTHYVSFFKNMSIIQSSTVKWRVETPWMLTFLLDSAIYLTFLRCWLDIGASETIRRATEASRGNWDVMYSEWRIKHL